MDYKIAIYILVVISIGLLVAVWLWRRVSKTEAVRKKRLKGFKNFDAVPTESPQDNHLREVRQQSLQNVETRFAILRRLLLPVLFVLLVLALIIPFLGKVPQTVISVSVAAVTVVVGIAARPFVENLIAGVVISFGKRVRVGDTVLIDEHYGTVEDITLSYTTIKEWNWRRYIIPNAAMLNKNIVNYTLKEKYYWVNVEFWVDYDSDIQLVEELATKAVENSANFANYEAPKFWVVDLTKEAAHCMVVGWANSPSQGWMLGVDTRKELIQQFKSHGIKSYSLRYQPATSSSIGDSSPAEGERGSS